MAEEIKEDIEELVPPVPNEELEEDEPEEQEDGSVVYSDGSKVTEDGKFILADGSEVTEDEFYADAADTEPVEEPKKPVETSVAVPEPEVKVIEVETPVADDKPVTRAKREGLNPQVFDTANPWNNQEIEFIDELMVTNPTQALVETQARIAAIISIADAEYDMDLEAFTEEFPEVAAIYSKELRQLKNHLDVKQKQHYGIVKAAVSQELANRIIAKPELMTTISGLLSGKTIVKPSTKGVEPVKVVPKKPLEAVQRVPSPSSGNTPAKRKANPREAGFRKYQQLRPGTTRQEYEALNNMGRED